MAIYHASFQIIGRSAGRSSVAASAYRSGVRLIDRTTGEVHHYVGKQAQSVSDAFILAPSGSPSWVYDRESLWSAVEDVERRKDAQLARELNVALPIELSQSQQTALIRDYVQTSFVDRGMVADVALHDLDSGNPHAHVMLTLRDIDGDQFGKKNRDWNQKALLNDWRAEWSVQANRALKQAGHSVQIDHRSYEAQGVERLPTIHLGHRAHQMEQRGIKTERGNYNRLVEQVMETLERLNQAIEHGVALGKERVLQAKELILGELEKTGSVLGAAIQRSESIKAIKEERQENERALKQSRSIIHDRDMDYDLGR